MKIKQLIFSTILAVSSASAMATDYTLNVAAPSFSYANNLMSNYAPIPNGAFTDTWTFILPGTFDVTGYVANFSNSFSNIDFSAGSVTLNGVALAINNTGSFSTAILDSTVLTGNLVLTINGTANGSPTYGGNFNITAVPEPESYVLMMAGLALVGFASRRKLQA